MMLSSACFSRIYIAEKEIKMLKLETLLVNAVLYEYGPRFCLYEYGPKKGQTLI